MTLLHKALSNNIYTGRQSDEKEYWHQFVVCKPDSIIQASDKDTRIAILGYCGDEGVRRNQGRIGASEGPSAIRKMMGPMAYHLPQDLQIFDFGNVETHHQNMEESHDTIRKFTLELLQKNYFPILLGGGHDLAYPHGSAAIEFVKSKGKKLGIINLDAHFDLRKTIAGAGHSGSPFYQLAEDYQNDFNYMCLGIQPAANPLSLFKKAVESNCTWVTAPYMILENWELIERKIEEFAKRVDYIYLTIDMDGFQSGIAPGVSAPSPGGFSAAMAFKIYKKIAQSNKLVCMDVVEVNPTYDIDHATARLAARSIDYLANCLFPNSESVVKI